MIKNNSDTSWEKIGREDPHYGVLSAEKFRKKNINDESIAEFFESGQIHIDKVLSVIRERFGAMSAQRSALDFGCGLGRLVIPLAQSFEQVTGIDISPSMLKAAENNCLERGIGNASFALSDDELTQVKGKYDLIHSFIVLQHIPPQRGEKIIRQMLLHLNDGGVLAIQVPFMRKSTAGRRMIHGIRKNFAPVNMLINISQGLKWNEPLIQMNNYDINRILTDISQQGIKDVFIEISDVELYKWAFIFAKRPAQP